MEVAATLRCYDHHSPGRAGVNERPSRPADHVWTDREGEIHIEMAPPTRVNAYIEGADPFFSVDREVAEKLFATVPGGEEGFRAVGRASQAFLERVVHHLTAEAGLRQFLVSGCNLSGDPNVHDIAQDIAPECRVVYLVLDPMMLALVHTLRGRPEGATAYIQAKLGEPGEILRQAATTLDLSRPVGVMIPASLAFVRRDATAYRITGGLMAGVASGSHLMLTHHASDIFVEEHVEMYQAIERLAAEGKTWGVAARSHAEVARFFSGLELVEPGIVPVDEWRASVADPPPVARGALYGAVGRKP
jgi:hypothetical protein